MLLTNILSAMSGLCRKSHYFAFMMSMTIAIILKRQISANTEPSEVCFVAVHVEIFATITHVAGAAVCIIICWFGNCVLFWTSQTGLLNKWL